jgi:branched-subunit amino acid transport protein
MESLEWLGIGLIALGTYLFRYIPLKTSISRLGEGEENTLTKLFEISGISIITSLLISSFHGVLLQGDWLLVTKVCLSSLAVLLSLKYTHNSGLSIITGIIFFAFFSFLLP